MPSPGMHGGGSPVVEPPPPVVPPPVVPVVPTTPVLPPVEPVAVPSLVLVGSVVPIVMPFVAEPLEAESLALALVVGAEVEPVEDGSVVVCEVAPVAESEVLPDESPHAAVSTHAANTAQIVFAFKLKLRSLRDGLVASTASLGRFYTTAFAT